MARKDFPVSLRLNKSYAGQEEKIGGQDPVAGETGRAPESI